MGGFAQTVYNRDQAARDDQLKLQTAPLSEALRADQTRLALYANPDDPTKPLAGKEAEYKQTLDRMTQTIGQLRSLYGQKPSVNPVEAGVGNLLDSLHITNHLKNHVANVRAQNAAKYQAQNQATADQYAQATPVNPYQQQRAEMSAGGFSPQDIETSMRAKAGLVPKDTTEQERFVTQYKTDHKGATDEEALRAYTDATTKTPDKPDAPLEAGGVAYGVRSGGKEYLASQLAPNGDAPPEAKQIWKTIQDAKQAKQDQEDKKEREANERQLRGLSAIASRMGQSEAFQEQMAQFRSDETTYRNLDKQARDAEESAQLYAAEANQPGNKSAFDTALVTDYTSILAKGGRKTQAEIAFAQKIGGLGLRTERMFDQARTGELPPEMRQMYIDYLQTRAASERKEADEAKPDLPQIAAPEGPKTKALKDKAAQKGSKSLADRLSEALQ